MSIITCKWEPKEKSLSSSIAVLDLDPVYGTASRISEIKANYYMGTKEKKCLSSSTAVLDLTIIVIIKL